MKITSVEFVKSVEDITQIPRGELKEIAFAGRSNVGKSSLINCLLNRKSIARTSSTPGKTRQLNYFKINDRFYFVDLPGYGFARASKKEKLLWQQLIESFFQHSANLIGVVAIIDSRIGPTKLDLQLLSWLTALELPCIIIATKADKLSKSMLIRNKAKISSQLNGLIQNKVIPFSAVDRSGKKEVWKEILSLLEKNHA